MAKLRMVRLGFIMACATFLLKISHQRNFSIEEPSTWILTIAFVSEYHKDICAEIDV
jgi:hypothetical protein